MTLARHISEKELQKAVVRLFRTLGYRKPREVVRECEAFKRKPDPKEALFWETMDAKGNRNDAGLPDIQFSPAGIAGIFGIELKKPVGGRLSQEQAVAVACGVYPIAKSIDEVLAIIEEASRA